MARMMVREGFKEEQKKKLAEGKPIDHITGEPIVAKWMVCWLSNNGKAFKVIDLGAGVKRITTDVDVCPKCNGTGRC